MEGWTGEPAEPMDEKAMKRSADEPIETDPTTG
jgi:hypothetical protein